MSWRQVSIEKLMQKRENNLLKSGYFTNLAIKEYPWSIQYSVRQYLDLLNTRTDYRSLPKVNQENLSYAITEIISAYGEFIVKPYVSALFLAQKA
jgi:hypothetical protein